MATEENQTGKKRGRGGPRPNSGRKRGSTKAMMALRKAGIADDPSAIELLKRVTPLQYMLGVMQDPKVAGKRRDDMAKAAAPYCHAKLSPGAGEGGGGGGSPQDLSNLTDDDLDALERISRKIVAKATAVDPAAVGGDPRGEGEAAA